MHSGYKSLTRYVICKYFHPIYRLFFFFHSLNSTFGRKHFKNFYGVQLINVFFHRPGFPAIGENSHPIFRSLVHFEFIFVYGVKEWFDFIVLHVTLQQYLLKGLFFSPLYILASFVID